MLSSCCIPRLRRTGVRLARTKSSSARIATGKRDRFRYFSTRRNCSSLNAALQWAGMTKAALALEWLDLRQLTQYAAVSERTLRTWIHDAADPLPASQVGSKILVRRRDFDAYIERHRI